MKPNLTCSTRDVLLISKTLFILFTFFFQCIAFTHAATNINDCAVCPSGNITLTSQADVDNFTTTYPGCTQLLGSLAIGPSSSDPLVGITNLNGLSGVTDIANGLTISNNPLLTDITGFNNLVTIGGGQISINDNPLLTDFDLSTVSAPNLTYVGIISNTALTDACLPSDITMINGNFIVFNNPILSNICENESLTQIGGYLQLNSTIDPILPAYSNLISVGSGIIISHNTQITQLPLFTNLTSISSGQITITDNLLLTDFDLSTVSAPNLFYVGVVSNAVLTDACLPSDITTISSHFVMIHNPMLSNICENESLTQVGGYIQIISTIDPVLPAYSNLVSIGNGLTISDNTQITQLPLFSSLTNINGGQLSIRNNSLLTDFDLSTVSAPALSYVGVLFNTVLTDACLPSDITTVTGNVVILSNPILSNICENESLTQIDGYFQIGQTIDPVLPAYSNLVSIGNGLIISGNTEITQLPLFSSLTNILGGTLDIRSNTMLPSIDLANVSAPNLVKVSIYNNAVLTTLSLPSDITNVSSRFEITTNPMLHDITEISNLATVGETLLLSQIADSTLPNFPNLTSVTNLNFFYNNEAIAFPSFPMLATISGAIFIDYNDLIESIDLSHVSAPFLTDLHIYDNAMLENIALPSDIVTITGRLQIGQNPLLSQLSEFENLETVDWFLDISNTALCRLPRFSNLEIIGTVIPNPSTSKGLYINSNAYITKIPDFPNLIQLDSILNITNNPLLSDCAIQAVCDYLPTLKNRTIAGNAGDCLDETAVDNHCMNGTTAIIPTFPADITLERGNTATLTIDDLPVGYEAIWYASDQTTILYQDAANSFDYTATEGGTIYGAYVAADSPCPSALQPVCVYAYYPLTARVEAYNASCSYANDGSAQVITHGGEQSIGTGNYVASEERYGFSGFKVNLADFNNDGYLDVYASNFGRHDDVWLNDGDGTYTYQQQEYNSTLAGGWSILADFNNDGYIDVYSPNGITTSDKVLLNDGDGSFTEMSQSYGINISRGGDAADINNDGNIDLVVTGSSFVVILLGNGDGTFSQQSNIGTTSYLGRKTVFGDLDLDGDLDIFVVNGAGLGATTNPPNPNQVYLNDGIGNFTLVNEDYGTNEASWDVELGDINNDGYLDAVVANWNGTDNKIYLNDGDGTFTESTQIFTTGLWTRGVELGDMDKDGDLDIFFAHFTTLNAVGNASVRQWFNDGNGNFTEDTDIYPEATDIAIGDLDLDGDLDVFSCNTYFANNTNMHQILYNDNGYDTPYTFNWSGGSNIGGGENPNFVIQGNLGAGDYTVTVADNAGDMVTVDFDISASAVIDLDESATASTCDDSMDGTASILASGGAPFELSYDTPIITIGTTPDYAIVLEDMNGDGALDIIAGNQNVIALNDGTGNFTQMVETTLPSSSSPYGIGDFDGDGDKDIFTTITNTGNFAFYENNGDLTFQAPVNYTIPGSYRRIEVGDINGDGSLDIVAANFRAGPNIVFINDGIGNFTQSVIMLGSEDTLDLKLGDLNNDGHLDIIAANSGHGDIVYLNDGLGNFTEYFIFSSGIASDDMYLGDINNDGFLDVVVDCYGYQATRIYFNDGDGTFTISNQLIPNIGRNDIKLADLDNDGDLDIITQKSRNPQPGRRGGEFWLNDGTGFFEEFRQNFTNILNLSSAFETGDLDGDGDIDLIVNAGDGIRIVRNSPPSYTYQWNDPNSQTTATATDLTPGTYNVTATDFRGCAATTTVEVLSDIIPPTCIAQDIAVQLDSDGMATIATTDIDNGSFDACGIATYALDKTSFDCTDIGANTVNLTVTDNTGNSATCSAMVTINYMIPVVEAGNSQTICSTQGSIDMASLGASIVGATGLGGTWSSSGDGNFDSNTLASAASYTFGSSDLTTGSVLLTLTSDDPSGLCGTVSDIVLITIDVVVCDNFPWDGN